MYKSNLNENDELIDWIEFYAVSAIFQLIQMEKAINRTQKWSKTKIT